MNVTTTPQRPASNLPARSAGAEALPPSIRNRLAQAGLTTPPSSATTPTPRR
jgi:hypothetical protein